MNQIYPVLGESVEVLVSSASTNHTCCVGVQTSPPGGGPPPHKHDREEEIFQVLEGQYEFFDGDHWGPFSEGEVKFSKRGTFHAFRNSGTSTGRLMFTTNAGGLDEFFAEISPLALPEDLDRMTEISKHHGYHFMPSEPLA